MSVESLISEIRDKASLENRKIELLSPKQLKTIASIPTAELDVHCGCYGCGKSYAISVGLGLACMTSPPPSGDGCIVLAGATARTVKANICNPLASLYGSNFEYSSSKKDGFDKDALLFGHRLRIIGLKDAKAEERIRGVNAYKIIGDEATLWGKTSDNFDRLQGRLRGELPAGWVHGMVVSTNPEGPKHWLKELIDNSDDINYVKWVMGDNITSGAEAYYNKLKARYKGNDSLYRRYILGEWSASSGLVYQVFSENDKVLLLSDSDVKILLDSGVFNDIVIGVDWGTTNPTAIIIAGVSSEGEMVVFKEYFLENPTVTAVVNVLRSESIKYHKNLKGIYIDPSANVVSQECIRAGIRKVYDADNSVLDGIDFVQDMFASQRLFIAESCSNLVGELYSYAWQPDSIVDKVMKVDDHFCDALRYACYTYMK